MATINFRVRGKARTGNILVRLKHGDKFDYEISTGLQVELDHWSHSKQKVKNIVTATYKDYVNNKLNGLKTFIESEYYKVLSNGDEVSQKWLKNNVNDFFERSDSSRKDNSYYLTKFADSFIKEVKTKINLRTGKPLSERAIGYYELTVSKIQDFEKFEGKRIKLRDINLEFHESFINYLSNEQLLNANTVGFYISKLIMFCKAAERKGIKINTTFKDPSFFAPSNKTQDVYLNIDEIDAIFQLELPFDSKLDNARDWFIIGLWTGLRVSDLLNLSNDNIDDSLISITNKKTGIPVMIPLHYQVKATLKKRKGNFPRKISDQKFNDYIKDVCELAKIDKKVQGAKMVEKEVDGKTIFRKTIGKYSKFDLVSSHICRRSFATNHYGKLDTLTIMKITGHKTEKQFLDYIKITPKEYAFKLKEFWKNQNK
jgi:integrase